jgi:phosphoribosylformylglycinamidine synthase subunit PurSL
MAFAGGLGLDIDADRVPAAADVATLDRLLFSESNSRIVLTVPAQRLPEATRLLAGVPHAVIGSVVAGGAISIRGRGAVLRADGAALKAAWQAPLAVVGN